MSPFKLELAVMVERRVSDGDAISASGAFLTRGYGGLLAAIGNFGLLEVTSASVRRRISGAKPRRINDLKSTSRSRFHCAERGQRTLNLP